MSVFSLLRHVRKGLWLVINREEHDMTDFAKLTRKQAAAVERAPDDRRADLSATFAALNVRDRQSAVKIALARDGVDVGDGLTQLSDTYRGHV